MLSSFCVSRRVHGVMIAKYAPVIRLSSVNNRSGGLDAFETKKQAASTTTIAVDAKASPLTSAVNTSSKRMQVVNFNDPSVAYKEKTIAELLRGYLVFTLCAIPVFVKNSDKLLKFSEKVIGKTLTYGMVKKTFFSHFCAGETESEIKPVMDRLAKIGIGGILDYAAESDVANPTGEEHRDKRGVFSARTFDYSSEVECDNNADIFLRSISAVAEIPNSFAAIKITALGKAALLEKVSEVLNAISDMFLKRFASISNDGKVSVEEFTSVLKELGVNLTEEATSKLFTKFDIMADDRVDYIEWTTTLRIEDMVTRPLFTQSGYNFSSITRSGHLPLLDEQETILFDNMVKRVERIAAAAAEKKVRLMIDAEQTYLQPAIDHFVLTLQRKYNTEFPTIFGTYQCYLTRSKEHLLNDLERARRENWIFAGKLVRGAYMVVERRRAEVLGIPSPILPTIEHTHQTYDFCMAKVIENIHRANLLIASHNQDSIEKSLELMETKNVDKNRVFFGQLLGMSDHISFPLGMNKYKVYKYIPWGPVHSVVPYLTRRVQENSGLLSNAHKERQMIISELFRRLNLFKL